jgi:site-specific recombinase XerD
MSSKPPGAEPSISFPALVQEFFTHYLVEQRALSPRTVAGYRDAFILFLTFAHQHLGTWPAAMKLADITPALILAFLDHLEQERHNSVCSRNARLAALRAFLKFASHRDPSALQIIEQALAVPMKRFEHPKLEFLSREEMLAIIGSPGTSWISRRDHLLLGLLYNTGARVSEIINVKVADIVFDGVACVHLHGKGRKHRAVPLWKSTIQEIRAWLRLNPQMGDDSALLPNRDGQAMTRNNIAQRVSLAATAASQTNTSLSGRHISPHCIRHASAMHLLQSGVDISVIALWLGHESSKTTYMYVEADLSMKERALARLQDPGMKALRYHAPDSLLQFLKSL